MEYEHARIANRSEYGRADPTDQDEDELKGKENELGYIGSERQIMTDLEVVDQRQAEKVCEE